MDDPSKSFSRHEPLRNVFPMAIIVTGGDDQKYVNSTSNINGAVMVYAGFKFVLNCAVSDSAVVARLRVLGSSCDSRSFRGGHGKNLGCGAFILRTRSYERGPMQRIVVVTRGAAGVGQAAAFAKRGASNFAIRGFTGSLRSELIHDKSRMHRTMVQLPAVNTPQVDCLLARGAARIAASYRSGTP